MQIIYDPMYNVILLAITVMFSQLKYIVNENNGPAQPVLVLSNSIPIPFTVQVKDTPGTAISEQHNINSIDIDNDLTANDDYDPGIYSILIPAIVPFDIPVVNVIYQKAMKTLILLSRQDHYPIMLLMVILKELQLPQ